MASDTTSWVVSSSITAGFAYAAFRVKPTWAKVLLGGIAVLNIPVVFGGPAAIKKIRAKKAANKAAVAAAAGQVTVTAGGLEMPDWAWMNPRAFADWLRDSSATPPVMAGAGRYGSAFAGAVC